MICLLISCHRSPRYNHLPLHLHQHTAYILWLLDRGSQRQLIWLLPLPLLIPLHMYCILPLLSLLHSLMLTGMQFGIMLCVMRLLFYAKITLGLSFYFILRWTLLAVDGYIGSNVVLMVVLSAIKRALLLEVLPSKKVLIILKPSV